MTHGYFLRRPDGSVYHAHRVEPADRAGHGALRHRRLHEPRGRRAGTAGSSTEQLALGADSFKPDFAEEIPEDARFANGLTGAEMHNPYPLLYQQESFEATQGARPTAWWPGPAARRRASSATRATGRGTRSARSSTSPTRSAAASPRR